MIELDPDQKTPLYEQLYAALADEIRTGAARPRHAAAGPPHHGRAAGRQRQHGGHRLPDAGRRGSGRVAPPQRLLCAEDLRHAAQPRPPRPRRPVHLPPPAPAPACPLYDLSTGSVDTALFPARSWGRIQKELLYQRPELLQRGEMQGDAAAARRRSREYLSDVPRCGMHAGADRRRRGH